MVYGGGEVGVIRAPSKKDRINEKSGKHFSLLVIICMLINTKYNLIARVYVA